MLSRAGTLGSQPTAAQASFLQPRRQADATGKRLRLLRLEKVVIEQGLRGDWRRIGLGNWGKLRVL